MRALVLLLCLLASPAGATTFYVAKTGNDGVSCATSQTIGTPRLTIAGGISCLTGGGDTLFVRAGTYVENITSGVPSGSSWSSYVRIAAFFPESVTLQPSGGAYALAFTGNEHYIEWDGINIDAQNLSFSDVGDNVRVEAWSGGSPHHIRIKNSTMLGTTQSVGSVNSQPQMVNFVMSVSGRQGYNELINCTLSRGGGNEDFAHAVYASSDHNLIEGNNISGFRGAGVQIYNGYSLNPSDNVVRNNIIHDSTFASGQRSWGMIIAGTGNQIYNNVIYSITNANSPGIEIFHDNAALYNNTIYGNPIGIRINDQSGAVIQNNILYNNSTDYNANGYSPTQDHNLIGTDPSFVDAAGHNFRLQNSSVAKDAGTNTGIGTDILGTVRSGTYDIGAYEYTDGGGGPGGPVHAPATGTTFVTDTYTGTAGTALASRAGETGASWTTQTGSSSGLILSDTNRLRLGTPDVDTFSYASGTPVSVQYDVRAGFHTFTTIADHTTLLWARMSTTERTGYFGMYNRVPGTLELWAVLANAYTLLGSCSVTFPNGSDYTVSLEVRTGTEQLWYWLSSAPETPTQCVSATDTSITTAGKVGVGMYAPTAASTNSTDIHYNDFTAQDVATTMGTTMCTTCRLRFVR